MASQPFNTEPTSQAVEDFWSNAVIGSSLGTLLGTISLMIVMAILDLFSSIGTVLIASIVGGLIAGATQGAFLRHYVQPKAVWLALSCAGWLTNVIVAGAIVRYWPSADLNRWIVIEGLGGAIIGTFQWLLLRRNWSRSVWWVPLNATAWAGITLVYLIIFGPLIGLASW